jgi:antitoxin VapB
VATQTKLFTLNQSQAVRLPRAVAFPDDVTNVEIIVDGDVRIITPVRRTFRAWLDAGGPFLSDDFPDREQPPVQEREGR